MKVKGVACWENIGSPLLEMRNGVDVVTLEGRSKCGNNSLELFKQDFLGRTNMPTSPT
jgi:hypothetical protein